MAHPKGVDHLSSPKNMDVIDVDNDTVHIEPDTPLNESDIAKIILKIDKLLKSIESSESENDITSIISPKNRLHSNHQQLIY